MSLCLCFIRTFLRKKCLFFCGRTSIFLFYQHNYVIILKGNNYCCNTCFLTIIWKLQNILFNVYMPHLQECNILTNGCCCTGSCMSLHVVRNAVAVCVDFFGFPLQNRFCKCGSLFSSMADAMLLHWEQMQSHICSLGCIVHLDSKIFSEEVPQILS